MHCMTVESGHCQKFYPFEKEIDWNARDLKLKSNEEKISCCRKVRPSRRLSSSLCWWLSPSFLRSLFAVAIGLDFSFVWRSGAMLALRRSFPRDGGCIHDDGSPAAPAKVTAKEHA
jgi:hypothetical protein